MEKQIVIAVIDSGINRNDFSLQSADIEDYYYENQEIRCGFDGPVNIHGTEVIKVILKEAPTVKIVSIRILQENNKCMLSDVIRAIRFAIDKKVDIINLSLGSCISKSKRAVELEQLCEEAASKGIVIFAAENNPIGQKSFPANFNCVIGVTSTSPEDPYCRVEYGKKMVTFSESMVYVPDKSRSIVRKGNSYLCPLLVGLFCSFAKGKKMEHQLVMSYLQFLEDFSKSDHLTRIFFNRYSDDRFLLNGKKVLYFADDADLNNLRMIEMYKEVCEISMCFDEIMNLKANQIQSYMENIDIFYIGALSPEFIYEYSDFLENLVKIIASNNTLMITVFPIINTYQRMQLTRDCGCTIKSIYK